MLLFNCICFTYSLFKVVFQNILCCCLTGQADTYCVFNFAFQNILCCCLTCRQSAEQQRKKISKHPMLLFNQVENSHLLPYTRFQNILCCCLTYSSEFCNALSTSFQNILCCCLTNPFLYRLFRKR